jgi:hypothetical protein
MSAPNSLTHVQNCWSRGFEYAEYERTARAIHPQFHVVSPAVYALLCAALHQDMIENIGHENPIHQGENNG